VHVTDSADGNRLRRSLRIRDGLAIVVGIMVGSGIFRTPGIVAARVGRPSWTFVAWLLGGALALVGAFVFAELSTRHPRAGGKYVYAGEAFGPRAAFVVGWVEAGIYCVAIAAIGVVCGEYASRLAGRPGADPHLLGASFVLLVTGVNLWGVALARWTQNVATTLKVLALLGVVVVAAAAGSGAGWTSSLPTAPTGAAVWTTFALAFQPVLWTYYGYPDAAKIAEEVKDPGRSLPRIYLISVAAVTALYLLLNAAYLHVLQLDRIAASPLVAGDVVARVFGDRAGAWTAALALVVVLSSLNGNAFTTPRVVFGLARDGLGPPALARVHRRGTPWTATLFVGTVSLVLAASGSFETLLSLAILLILLIDGFMMIVLFRLRSGEPASPFGVPLYPWLPSLFLAVYALCFAAGAVDSPPLAGIALATVGAAYGLARATVRSGART